MATTKLWLRSNQAPAQSQRQPLIPEYNMPQNVQYAQNYAKKQTGNGKKTQGF